jgi:hypothetical protein
MLISRPAADGCVSQRTAALTAADSTRWRFFVRNGIAADLWESQNWPRRSRYATSGREILGRFLLDGRIEIDSNIVERAIRPQTITRKNALLAGSDGGGRTRATIATLRQTAKMNDVDPLAWLA